MTVIVETIYVETTVIGNIAGRDHPDTAIAARQQLTRRWWKSLAARRYKLFVSELTISECSDGDSGAAAERLAVISGIDLVEETPNADQLASLLIQQKALPATEPRDAPHIALAAVNSVDFLASWNFKHILNPHLQQKISDTCRDSGYTPPIICTPQQLAESDDPT